MNWLRLFRSGNGSPRRLQARRRPIVENLEGRQLLSGIQGNHLGNVADVQNVRAADFATGKHLDSGMRVAPYSRHAEGAVTHVGTAMIQGAHIGTSMIVGAHIGTAMIQGAHIGSPMIVGAHIGSPMIVGNHIGVSASVGKHIGKPMIVGNHIGTNAIYLQYS